MAKLTQQEKDSILEANERGVSNREIAREVLGKESRESTVRNFLKVHSWGNEDIIVEDGSHDYSAVTSPNDFQIEAPLTDLFKESSVETSTENPTESGTEDPLDKLTDTQLDFLCDVHTDDLMANLAKRLRTAHRTNNQLRSIHRGLFDGAEADDEGVVNIEDTIENAAKTLNKKTSVKFNYKPSAKAEPATLEVLLGDLQIGKVGEHYNTDIAKRALKMYGEGILQAIAERAEKFAVERVVLVMLGDTVEDHEKHGVGSAISTDTGMSEQIHDAIESIWGSILEPLANLEIPMEVVCVVGNHGSSTRKGMGNYKEGLYGFDFIIYKTLESFCRISKFDWVTFNRPDGVFAHYEIYGKHAIAEHGYFNKDTEKGMTDQLRKRGSQLQVHPTYWRQGDKHHSAVFGVGELVLNAAVFGIDSTGVEYSGCLGFSSTPCQTVMFHTDDQDLGKSTVKDILHIQLAITD